MSIKEPVPVNKKNFLNSKKILKDELNISLPEDGYLGNVTSKNCGNIVSCMVKKFEETLISKK